LLAYDLQVYVKASAFFRVSTQQYPYTDACRGLKALVDAFGAQRVMWGTDFPWITTVDGFG
jgi:predicted TIM-barrel fold metal-dependent hydrolase